MEIDFGAPCFWGSVKWRIEGPHLLPIVAELVERAEIETCITWSMLKGGHDGVEVRLRGGSAHGSDGEIDHIAAGIGGAKDAPGVDPTGVVGVKMDGNSDGVLECFDESAGGVGATESRHILNGEKVRAHFLEFFGHGDIVLE